VRFPLSSLPSPLSLPSGYSVFVSSQNIIIGAPRALHTDGTITGAVYLYHSDETSQQWLEEKIVPSTSAPSASASGEMNAQAAFGSRVYATNFALFVSDVPGLLMAPKPSAAVVPEGQVYVLWTDSAFTSLEESETTTDSIWTSTVVWALVLVTIPVAIAFALVSYRYRASLCVSKNKQLLPSSDTPNSASSLEPSPFLFASCVDHSSEATVDKGPAAIIRLSPLMKYVLKPSAAAVGTVGTTRESQSFSDVESNCSNSPAAGRDAKANWKLSGLTTGRRDYRQLAVPDSPSCRSEVSTLSTESRDLDHDQGDEQAGWMTRLSNALRFNAPLSLAQQDSLARSSLQSPTPTLPPLHNPMLSPAVVE
jgi:hypothetical protein